MHAVTQPFFSFADNVYAKPAEITGLSDWAAISISNDRSDTCCLGKSVLNALDFFKIE
jgi:hypothetical protein